jgi:hypothetical protein
MTGFCHVNGYKFLWERHMDLTVARNKVPLYDIYFHERQTDTTDMAIRKEKVINGVCR